MKQWNLIRLRKEAGISQEKMANYLNVHISTYMYKENGKKDFNSSEMFKISELFNKSIDEIFLPPNSILNRITI